MILINLGRTNDELGKYFDYGEFVEAHKAFIRKVGSYYKGKPFLFVCGQMNKNEKLVDAIFKAAKDLGEEGVEALSLIGPKKPGAGIRTFSSTKSSWKSYSP